MCRREQHAELLRELQQIRELLSSLNGKADAEMAAIDTLNTADTDLKNEVAAFIADWQAQLQAAQSANDPAIQAVAADMETVVTTLKSDDSANTPTPAPAPPASS